jgi:hypothetical protein
LGTTPEVHQLRLEGPSRVDGCSQLLDTSSTNKTNFPLIRTINKIVNNLLNKQTLQTAQSQASVNHNMMTDRQNQHQKQHQKASRT